ncbi:hypothetical protein Drorol1_Dr00023671 [Drosera rotundifolia]
MTGSGQLAGKLLPSPCRAEQPTPGSSFLLHDRQRPTGWGAPPFSMPGRAPNAEQAGQSTQRIRGGHWVLRKGLLLLMEKEMSPFLPERRLAVDESKKKELTLGL